MVLDLAFALFRREPLGQRLHVRGTARASAWSLASFAAQGLHVAILALAIGGGGFSTVLLCTGGMALAVSAGVLFILAPAGAGVRDLLLALVLGAVLTSGESLAVVVASRVILIVADLALAAAAASTRRPATLS
jgi:glycosyltransferase 2 family protein